jgi:hypothetical protein
MTQTTRKVKAVYRPLNEVSIVDAGKMHELFSQYYHNAPFDVFLSDLRKKDGVILLREQQGKNIVGFSTMQIMELEVGGRKVRGLFSGDTVSERRYWGNRAMLSCFARQLLRFRLQDLTKPLYWLLISKGFKTYLILTNNFPKHYPHVDGQFDQQLAPVVDAYCEKLFPAAFDREHRVLQFGEGYQKLKGDVAEITPEMKLANPKIRYFEEQNPTWRDGTELPCVGQVTFSVFWAILRKALAQLKPKREISLRLPLLGFLGRAR